MSNRDVPAGGAGGHLATPGRAAGLDLPDRLRVHALAKLLAVSSRQVLAELAELGSPARSAQSSVDRETAVRVAAALLPDGTDGTDAAPVADAEADRDSGEVGGGPGQADQLAPLFAPPVFLSPQPRPAVGAEPVAGGDAEDRGEDGEAADSEAADSEAADSEEPRRRRRRGRRGRGRGRGADQDGGDDQDEAGDASAASATREPAQPQETPEPAAGEQPETATAAEGDEGEPDGDGGEGGTTTSRRRRRRRRRNAGGDGGDGGEEQRADDPLDTVLHVRAAGLPETGRAEGGRRDGDEVQGVRGSTRLEAKRQRRRDGREAGRRRLPILSESEFLARRESVERTMVVRQRGERTQIGVLEDGVLVEHFVTSAGSASMVGNVYLGRVQNVLPSMEAAFVDIGRGRNAVLYAGEVDWDAAGLEGKQRRIEQALSSGDSVLVQVTKDPVGHKGARLTTQISLPGRFLVYVPSGGATGISRKLPDVERRRLKDLLRQIVPDDAGVIIRTASEGVSEAELDRDVRRLQAQWKVINAKMESKTSKAPQLLYEEPDLLIKVVRDLFNEDFSGLVVSGEDAWDTLDAYVSHVAPDLASRLHRHVGTADVFTEYRIDEQILKALERKVWLPSGGTLVIDRTEAMTVIDVNTGKFTGSGGNLEETVTRNNLEAAEEIVRQLRLRDIGGIIVIDFIDMVLETNRDLVLRRLTECLARDRTRHQVAEVTSLGLVQMTRKRVGAGLLDVYSLPCEVCRGRGVIVSTEPVEQHDPSPVLVAPPPEPAVTPQRSRGRAKRGDATPTPEPVAPPPASRPTPDAAVEPEVSAAQVRVSEVSGAEISDNGATTAVTEPESGGPLVLPQAAPGGARNGRQRTAAPGEPPGEPASGPAADAEDRRDGEVAAGRRRRRVASRPAGPPAVGEAGAGRDPV